MAEKRLLGSWEEEAKVVATLPVASEWQALSSYSRQVDITIQSWPHVFAAVTPIGLLLVGAIFQFSSHHIRPLQSRLATTKLPAVFHFWLFHSWLKISDKFARINVFELFI